MEFDSSKLLKVADTLTGNFGPTPGTNISNPGALLASQPGVTPPGQTVKPAEPASEGASKSTSSPSTSSSAGSGTTAAGSSKAPGETGVKTIADRIMEVAASMGEQAKTEAQKIAERDVLLSQLFLKYGGNEQDVIDFINRSLFQVKLSHDELIELTDITIQAAAQSGQSIKEINDFALAHIQKIQNPQLTKTVIEEATKLKSMFRSIPVFEILANDFSPGSYSNAEQYVDNPLMFGSDPANFLLFQELRAMTTKRNTEQVELIRREYEDKLRNKQKSIEVANRKRAIVDMMESIEYLDAETAAVNKVSEIFQASVLNPNVKMFRRLFRDLKAGQVLKDEFLGGMQFKSTEIPFEEIKKTQPTTVRVPTVRGSESNNNIVVAQALPAMPNIGVRQSPTTEIAVDPAKADETFNKNKKLINQMLVNQITDAKNALKALSGNAGMARIANIFSRLIASLNDIRVNLPSMKSSTFTSKFFPIINQTGIELKLEAENLAKVAPPQQKTNLPGVQAATKSFVKLAAPPYPTPATSPRNFATYNPSADPWVEGGLVVLAGASFLATLAEGDLAGAGAIAASAWLLYQQNMALKVARVVGRPLPKNMLTANQIKASQKSLEQMGASSQEAQTLITLRQYRDNAKDVIINLESNLMARIEGEVARGKSSSSIASAPPEAMKKDFDQFVNFLNNAIKVVQYENNLVDTLRQRALNKITKVNPLVNTNLMAYKAQLLKDLREFFLEKKRRYSSFAVVVDNYIKSSRLINFIRREIPFAQNFMEASGSSVADMVLGGIGQGSKGGLLAALDKGIDLEKNNVERLQAAIFKKDPKAFENFYGKDVTNFRSPSMALDNPVPPTRPASTGLDNFRFSNIIIEAQTTPVTPPPPVTSTAPVNSAVIDRKANETLANMVVQLGYTYKDLSMNIPYAELQNDPINMRVMQAKIDAITDEQLKKAVSDKFKKKLDENKSLSAQLSTDRAKELKEQLGMEAFYKLISNSPGILAEVTPTPETQAQDDEADMASLMEQYNVALQNLAKIEEIRMKILRNPSDLGALSSFVGAKNTNKFVKIAEKESSAEEPEEEVFEYYDELLPGYGDIFKNPEKYLNQTVQEVEEKEKKKNPSHNK